MIIQDFTDNDIYKFKTMNAIQKNMIIKLFAYKPKGYRTFLPTVKLSNRKTHRSPTKIAPCLNSLKSKQSIEYSILQIIRQKTSKQEEIKNREA